jgi:hypothetical protein
LISCSKSGLELLPPFPLTFSFLIEMFRAIVN